MSLTQQNNLFSVVMELQRTVQLLAEKVEVMVPSSGPGVANVAPIICDEAARAAEHKGKGFERVGPFGFGDGSIFNKFEQTLPADAENGVRVQDSNVVEMTFGGFKGQVPEKGKGRHEGYEIGSDFVSDSSSLIEAGSNSWSDMVEEEEAMNAAAVESKENVGDHAKFYKDFVRVPEVRRLREFLLAKGVVIKKSQLEELSLARYTAATVPDAFKNGKNRLRSLALVGDKFMAAAAVDRMYFEGRSASEIQNYLSRAFTRIALSPVCVNSGLGNFIIAPSGVDLGKTAVGGEALEAVAGVVFHSSGLPGLNKFMHAMQLA